MKILLALSLCGVAWFTADATTDHASQAPTTQVLASQNHMRPDIPKWVVRPCHVEDDVNCRWNAQTQGNGRGHTFIIRRMPGDITGLTCIFYVQPRYAANHDHCAPRGEL